MRQVSVKTSEAVANEVRQVSVKTSEAVANEVRQVSVKTSEAATRTKCGAGFLRSKAKQSKAKTA